MSFVPTPPEGLGIARGLYSGITYVHKFGYAPDFDTTDGAVSIWDGANDGGINAMQYTYSTTADIDSISSSSAGDTQAIEVQGLIADGTLTTQTVTLQGQTRVALTTALWRVFRMKNTGSTDNAGNIYCYKNGAITAGVPDTAADVRAVIEVGLNQTLMAIYTVPLGKTGYITRLLAATAGANKTADYLIDFFVRPSGKVFQIKHRTTISDTGDTSMSHFYDVPEKVDALSDIAVKATCLTGGTTAIAMSAGFDLILVDD